MHPKARKGCPCADSASAHSSTFSLRIVWFTRMPSAASKISERALLFVRFAACTVPGWIYLPG